MHKKMKLRTHGADVLDLVERFGGNRDPIVDFSSNVNIFSPVLNFQKIFQKTKERLNQYPDLSYRKLRSAIGSHYKVDSRQIVLGNGASELIYLIARSPRFHHVGIVEPTFSEYERGVMVSGGKVRKLCFEQIDRIMDGEEDAILDGLDLLILCNPNNPTGEIRNLEPFIRILNQKSIFTLVDETFIDFTDNKSYSLLPFLKKYPTLSILKAVTKYHALTGLRLGYLFTAHPSLADELWENKEPWSVNCLAENTAIEMFSEENKSMLELFRKKTQNYYQQEISRLRSRYFNEEYILKISDTVTNFFLFKLDMPMTGYELKETLFREYGYLIRLCADFEGLDDKWVRIAVKEPHLNDALLDAIRFCINKN